jgi:hypothetical protein
MTKQKLKNLVATGRLEQAIKALLEATANDPHLHGQVIVISGNYNALKRLSGASQTSFPDATQKRAEITGGLLGVIDELPDDEPVKTQTTAIPEMPALPYWKWALGVMVIVVAGLLVWLLLRTPPGDGAKDNSDPVTQMDPIASEPPKPQAQPVVEEPVSIDFYGAWKNLNEFANTMKTLTISKDDNNQVRVEVVSVSAELGNLKAQVIDKNHLVLAPFKYSNYATYQDANIYLQENGTLKMVFTAVLHDQNDRRVPVEDHFSK